MTQTKPKPPKRRSFFMPRIRLIRHMLIFQLKLTLEATRDVILTPVSTAACVLDLVLGGFNPGGCCNRLMKFGDKTDRWLNMFGPLKNFDSDPQNQSGLDNVLNRMERLLVEECQNGRLTESAKSRVKQSLNALKKNPARPNEFPNQTS